MSNFNQRLKEIRINHNITQKQLSIDLGLSERGIQSYELGKKTRFRCLNCIG